LDKNSDVTFINIAPKNQFEYEFQDTPRKQIFPPHGGEAGSAILYQNRTP
jgi:hypothetical protein